METIQVREPHPSSVQHSPIKSNNFKYLNHISPVHGYMEWQVKSIFRTCLDPPNVLTDGGTPDSSKPYITCFLGDYNPIKEDALSTSEVNAVMWLTCIYMVEPEYSGHQIIPVSNVQQTHPWLIKPTRLLSYPARTGVFVSYRALSMPAISQQS